MERQCGSTASKPARTNPRRYMLRFETGDPSVEVAEAEVRLVGATKVIERFPSIK